MRIKNNLIEILISLGVFVLLIQSSDPIYYTDSARYLNGSLIDPPLYSTIIFLMKSIFGTLNSLVIFQTLIIGFSIIYLTRTFGTHFNLDIKLRILISILLFLPILKFYDILLTEPIGYAFSLFFVSFMIKLIYNFNIQNLIWSTILAILLLLTRNQFLFIYPVIFLIYSTIFIRNSSKKILTMLVASFFCIFVIHNSLIFIDTYLKKDSFKTNSLTYNSYGPFFYLFIDSIYISKKKDSELFENKNIKKTVSDIIKEMDNRKSLIEYYNGRGHFGQSLIEIREYSIDLLKELAIKENISVTKLKVKISTKLMLKNYRKYIKQIFKKLYDSSWLFIFLPFLMFVAGFISFLKYRSNLSQVILFVSLFSLTNHSVVYLFGRVQPRYFIYTDFILLLFIFIIFINFLKVSRD